MRPGLTSRRTAFLLALAPAAFLLVFLVWPSLRLAAAGITRGVIDEVVGSAYYRGRLGWTLWQAAFSTLLTLLLGVPAALAFGRYRFPGREALLALLTLPFVVPTVVAANGFLALVGPRGLLGLNLQGTPLLIFWANVFFNYALVVRIVGAYVGAVGPRLEEAARTLGSSPWRVFWRVTLPVARPGVLAAGALVFLYTFTSFGVPLLLGGQQFATVEVEIYELVVQRLRLGEAGVLAAAQLVVTLAAVLLYTRAQALSAVRLDFPAAALRRPRGPSATWLAVNVLVAALLTLAPLAALVVRAFSGPDGPTLANLSAALAGSGGIGDQGAFAALGNTLRFSLLALCLALPLGLLLALAVRARESRTLDAASLLPLMVSPVTVGTGYLIAYPAWSASLGLLLAVYGLLAAPFVTRAALPALRAIPPSLPGAARVLGSTPGRAFLRVTLPLLRPALLTGAALAFATVAGEFAATLVLTRPEWTTLSTLIYQRLGRPGGLERAAATSLLLLAFSGGGFLLLDRLGRRR